MHMIRISHQLTAGLMAAMLLAPVGAANADEFTEGVQKLCDKMKQCAMESLKGQEIPPEMKGMIEQQLDQSCVSLEQNYAAALQNEELYQPAIACMNSLLSKSCEEIQQSGTNQTGACKELEAKAKVQASAAGAAN
jgi:hypothetical protein